MTLVYSDLTTNLDFWPFCGVESDSQTKLYSHQWGSSSTSEGYITPNSLPPTNRTLRNAVTLTFDLERLQCIGWDVIKYQTLAKSSKPQLSFSDLKWKIRVDPELPHLIFTIGGFESLLKDADPA